MRRGILQSGHCYTLKTTTIPTPQQCRCRMLGPSLCPDTQRPTVTRLKTCAPHCWKIGVLHGERWRGAQRHMPCLVSTPCPAGRGFNVRRAQRARRHQQFGTPCILACWAKRVRYQRLQMREEEGDGDDSNGDYRRSSPLFAVAKAGGSDMNSDDVVESPATEE